MMNPLPPPAATDAEFKVVVHLLAALADPGKAAERLAEIAAKVKESSDAAADVRAAGEKLAADSKAAHAAIAAARSAHEAEVSRKRTELDVAGAALQQRSQSLDDREAKLDTREQGLNSRDASISKRERTFAQAASLLAG